jgi:hypothetical protein
MVRMGSPMVKDVLRWPRYGRRGVGIRRRCKYVGLGEGRGTRATGTTPEAVRSRSISALLRASIPIETNAVVACLALALAIETAGLLFTTAGALL